MRKIYPGGEYALQIRPADQKIGKELLAVKLDRVQAIGFPFGMTVEEMMNKYPRLAEREQYDGYIAVAYGGNDCFIDVCYLRGAFIKATEYWKYTNYSVEEAVKDGIYYDVIYTTSEGKELTGAFQYVWSFNACKFAEECRNMQKEGGLSGDIDADKLDKSLKEKVVAAFIAALPVEVSDEEYLVLRRYLGFSKDSIGEVLYSKNNFFRWYKDNKN